MDTEEPNGAPAAAGEDEETAEVARSLGQTPAAESGETAAGPAAAVPRRLTSLDAFRGLTILGMLLVNNIALDTQTPPHLMHAMWNHGVHFADLMFPWFLLIIGVAIPFAAAANARRGLPAWRYDLRILTRAGALVLLGLLIDSSLAKQPVFDLGVLQIIGLAYLVGAMFYELPTRRRLILAAGLLCAHWAAIRFIPIPGVGPGVFQQKLNLIQHLNQIYLAPAHLNGLISVVPTAALVLIGTALGDALRAEGLPGPKRAAYLLAGGIIMLALGWLWNLDLPFNKAVWTAPYIIYSAGWGAIVLGLFYLLIDVTGWSAWAYPLVVPGVNAITAYVAPILVKIYILQQWTWKLPDGSRLPLNQAFMHFWFTHAGRYLGGWLYTLCYIVAWWLVLWWMYRKRIIVRV